MKICGNGLVKYAVQPVNTVPASFSKNNTKSFRLYRNSAANKDDKEHEQAGYSFVECAGIYCPEYRIV
jgi:hypothetical protein